MEKRLYRSRDNRMIWGVCGGIAEYFDVDPTFIRLIAILILVLSAGTAIIAYIIMAIVIPLESSHSKEPKDVIKENVQEMKQTATQFGEDVRSTFARREGESKVVGGMAPASAYVIAAILIVLGIFLLLANFNFFWWFTWGRLWPAVLIIIGLVILFGRQRK